MMPFLLRREQLSVRRQSERRLKSRFGWLLGARSSDLPDTLMPLPRISLRIDTEGGVDRRPRHQRADAAV